MFINKIWRKIQVESFLLIWGNEFCVHDWSPTGKCDKLLMCQEEKKLTCIKIYYVPGTMVAIFTYFI